MADPMKIRARLKGDVTEIRVLMSHPMESGQRKDNSGNAAPAHFIQTIRIAINGNAVIQGQTGTSVSRNPFFAFKVKGAKVGDTVSIGWVDSEGEQRVDETTIVAG